MRIGSALAVAVVLCTGVAVPATAQSPAPPVRQNESGMRAELTATGTVQIEGLNGSLVKAETKSGNSLTLIVIANDNRQNIENRIDDEFAKAGFRKIKADHDTELVSGRLRSEQRVLAFEGSATVITDLAKNLLGDADELKRDLDRLGLSDYAELRTDFFSTGTGSRRIFVLIGPKQFDSNKPVGLSAIALDKFSDNGFSYVGLTQKITVVHGRLGTLEIFALVGPRLASSKRTGSK